MLAACWVGIEPAVAQISGVLDQSVLPFARPSRTTLAASSHKVLAHWHVYPFRYYFEDGYVGWLNPTGYVDPALDTGSQYFGAGGYIHNRPLPLVVPGSAAAYDQNGLQSVNAAQTNGDFQADMATDITLAAEIGIDGFMMNFWYGPSSPSDSWRWTYQMQLMFSAAEAYTSQNQQQQLPGFSVAPNIDAFILGGLLNGPSDCSAIAASSPYSPETFAENVYSLIAAYPLSFMRLNGNYVVGVFGTESLPLCWYSRFRGYLAQQHSITSLYMMAVFVDPGQRQNYVTTPATFNGYSRWDTPPYSQIASETSDQSWAHGNQMDFVSDVSQSYDLPTGPMTSESGGFQAEIGTWTRAIQDQQVLTSSPSDMVQIITWNDHGEGTNLRPNTASQYAYYDIAAYYIAWYKTGSPPPITRDVLYYSHRIHLSTAAPSAKQTVGSTLSKNGIALADQVYLAGFLTSGGTMSILAGGTTTSQSFGPGIQTMSAPLAANDQPQFSLSVGGATTISLLSAFHTRPNPATPNSVTWQDLLYRAGGSARPTVTGVENDLPQDRCAPASSC